MKHSYGLTIGIYARQRDYSRGQTLLQWLLWVNWGAVKPWSLDELHRLGGYAKWTYWLRVQMVGVSVQLGVEHCLSNWGRGKPKPNPQTCYVP